jgi:hypothetical protein
MARRPEPRLKVVADGLADLLDNMSASIEAVRAQEAAVDGSAAFTPARCCDSPPAMQAEDTQKELQELAGGHVTTELYT